MDLSGLIFVALAIAWAAYLIPKALRHHDDVARARTVDQFSDHLRVLARREPVSAKAARLVVSKTRSVAGRTTTAGAAVVETDAPEPMPASGETSVSPAVREEPVTPAPHPEVRRPARRSAARRRRRVLAVLLVLLLGTAAVAVSGHLAPAWIAAPAALLVAWLVACRVMVKGERAAQQRRASGSARGSEVAPAEEAVVPATPTAAVEDEAPVDTDEAPATEPAEAAEAARSGLWDPLPMTLPTYVTKSKATRRTVRTIDLDDSDVWTSGRTEVDAALAREADAERPPVAPDEPRTGSHAVGS